MKKVKVVLVQPIQAPYWTERLKLLARKDRLEIFLLLESENFDNRPGWRPEAIPGVTTIVLGSQVNTISTKYPDMGYSVSGVRTIPWQLSKTLNYIKPDVVVVCNATQLFCALPSRWRLGFVLSLIVEDTMHSIRHQSKLQFSLKKFIYKKADIWIPFNQDAKVFLGSLDINKGIYPSSWSVDSQRAIPDPFAKSKSSKLVVSVVGALIERKGIMPLLRAWNRIPRENRQLFELRIAGTGPLQKTIEDYIRGNNIEDVVLLGQLPHKEVIRLFQSSSLSILPTLEDVYGMVVLEAMACGCPIITTPYAGARELVEDGVTGWIADPLDYKDLTEKLIIAMSNNQHLDEMGINARNRALAHETNDVMEAFAQQLIDISENRSF